MSDTSSIKNDSGSINCFMLFVLVSYDIIIYT